MPEVRPPAVCSADYLVSAPQGTVGVRFFNDEATHAESDYYGPFATAEMCPGGQLSVFGEAGEQHLLAFLDRETGYWIIQDMDEKDSEWVYFLVFAWGS